MYLKKVLFFITWVYGHRIQGSSSERPNTVACNFVPTGESVLTDDWEVATDLIPCLWFRKENLHSKPRNRVFRDAHVRFLIRHTFSKGAVKNGVIFF